MEDLISPGDLPEDILLKKNFYLQLKNVKFDKVMLTKCYFNKIKFGTTYEPEIEKIIK